MTRIAAVVAVLLASLALAGCAEKKGGGEVVEDNCELEPALCNLDAYLANHPCIINDWEPRIYAPDTPGPEMGASPWQQGDYWTYELTLDGQTQTTTLVYYDDADINNAGQAQHYLVGTSSAEQALDHALFSINPMLGRIHRTLYSPHESGVHSDMFFFPLCPGSGWDTGFYDTSFRMSAARETLTLPDGTQDTFGFRITGTSPDGSTLTHTYSPIAKWFTSLHLERADGLRLDLTLKDQGSGRSGTYYFLRAQQDHVMGLAGAPAETSIPRDGEYDRIAAYLEVARTAGTGRIEVHLRDPAGTSVACVGVAGSGLGGATQCPAGPLKVQVPFAAGEWTLTVEKPLLDSTTQAAGEARIVSVQDRSGNV